MNFAVKKLQITRRIVQLSVVGFMLLVPAVSRYNNYLSARELDKVLEKWEGSIQGYTLTSIDRFFRLLPGGERERAGNTVRNRTQVMHYAQQVRGGPWSAQIADFSLTDPLAGVESMAASKRVVKVLLISLILPLALTLLLGRVFCSWICPMNLLLEGTDKLRAVLRFMELKVYDVRLSRSVKYILLLVGLALTYILSLPVLGYVYPPAILNRELHDLVFTLYDRAESGLVGFSVSGLTWLSLIILAIVFMELIISRRWWCRYICPGGALYSLLGWARLIRVERASEQCTRCGECVTACQMGLIPMNDITGHECDNCGLCISACNDGALNYAVWRKPEICTPSFEDQVVLVKEPVEHE